VWGGGPPTQKFFLDEEDERKEQKNLKERLKTQNYSDEASQGSTATTPFGIHFTQIILLFNIQQKTASPHIKTNGLV
jgi:hypothetical protein